MVLVCFGTVNGLCRNPVGASPSELAQSDLSQVAPLRGHNGHGNASGRYKFCLFGGHAMFSLTRGIVRDESLLMLVTVVATVAIVR